MSESNKWVVVELSHQGEKKSTSELIPLIENEIGSDLEIFVPSLTYSRYDRNVTICLMEGYFFVEGGRAASTYFVLEESPYVQRVLSRDEDSGRYLCYVGQETVDELRGKLQKQAARDIRVGDYVLVNEGAYQSLKGKILDVFMERERATVHIVDLKSMEIIVELPFQFFGRPEPPEEHENE
jgi:transcription antitermination factor NusG